MTTAVAARRLSPRWPRTLAALEVRNYRLYLSSQIVATTGLWMQRIAQDWLVLELTGSVTAVGVAVALQFLPVLLFGLVGGVIADRYPKRRILLITQSVAASMAADPRTARADRTPSRPGTCSWWPRILGFVTAVDNPTRQVFVSELVGDPAHPQRRQPELLGLPVRRAGRPGAVRAADPRGRSGLVVHDQLRVLPAGGDHRGRDPGAGQSRPSGPVRAKGQLRERARATSSRRPRSPGPSCWSAPSACSA